MDAGRFCFICWEEARMEISPVFEALAMKAIWLLVVILLDLALGVTVSVKQGTFEWQKLADVLSNYGPKAIGWLALEALDLMPPQFKIIGGLGDALGTGAYLLLFTSAIGSILGHIQALGLLPRMKTTMTRLGLPPTTNGQPNA
jgi:hypothetical protein